MEQQNQTEPDETSEIPDTQRSPGLHGLVKTVSRYLVEQDLKKGEVIVLDDDGEV
jgi:hypothetical protein